MNFDKKYWSVKEYTTDNTGLNFFTGFVGIKDEEAYEFESGLPLYKVGIYSGHINTQKENFDRILSRELKLPYAKEDVVFAANDFLYPSILQTAIKRLQDNNDYLYRNAIISNSIIPYTDECILLTSIDNKDKETTNNGKLFKYDFGTSAFKTKTALDPTFYPQTKEESKYFVYNKFGSKLEKLDKDTRFINTGKEPLTYPSANKTDRENWLDINGLESNDIDDEEREITEDDVLNFEYSSDVSYGETLDKSEASSGSLLGLYSFSEVKANTESNIKFNSDLLTNLCITKKSEKEDLYSSSDINFIFKEVEFIIKGAVPSSITISTGNNSEGIRSDSLAKFRIDEHHTHAIYGFNSEKSFNIKNAYDAGSTLEDSYFNIPFKADGDAKDVFNFCSFYENNIIKAVIKYTTGINENKLSEYKTIPAISRTVHYSYIWTEEDEDGKEITNIANKNLTYKFLTESIEWLEAKNPKLKLASWGYNDVNQYIPNDDMTASDVYNYMLNRPADYWYPSLHRNAAIYSNFGEKSNQLYKEKIYPIVSYKFEIDNTKNSVIVQDYKNPEDIYNHLKTKENNIELSKKYDKVPDIFESRYIITDTTKPAKHNFNEIVSSEIIARDFNDNEKSCNLIIFLLFKTKLLIFKTKYFYSNLSAGETNSNQNVILQESDLKNPHFYIDLLDDKNYIEITHIDPRDDTSLLFLNLNSIKIHKNMLYLVDNKLDMVLRYSIDYIVNEDESIETAFNANSISLIDVMQGYGDSTDKIYFNNPYSIDVCDEGVYIADRGNNCVKSYTPALNYRKTIKNGFFSQHDIQAVAVNPFPCVINGIEINANSLWIASVFGTRIFLSVLEDDIVKVYGQIEDISLLQDNYSWLEEVRGIHFSKVHSNYFYLSTTKRVYKLHISEPFYPFASLSYFKQRSLIGNMRWSAMKRPWHKVPSIYSIANLGNSESVETELTWDYIPPTSSAEILDNKCFCLTGNNRLEGDIIFHFGVLYDESKIRDYIKRNKANYENNMTFYDIDSGSLVSMIKSSSMLFYMEPVSYISALANSNMKMYDIYSIEDSLDNDYINALTVNKLLYALIYNLLLIKNSLLGHFRAATNLDNVIVYDNLIMDDYFNKLQIGAEEDYFVHENEHLSIIANRTLENIYDLQDKILQKMQTEFMAAQSYVNNTSRII